MQIWVLICFDFAELCEVQLGHFWSSYKNVRFRGGQWINNVGSAPLCPMLTEQQMKIENLYLCWLWKYLTPILARAKTFPKVDPTYSFPHSFTVVFTTPFPTPSWNKPWAFSARVPRFSACRPPRPPSRVSSSGCKFSDSLSEKRRAAGAGGRAEERPTDGRIVKERTAPIVSRTELKADIGLADVAADGAQKCEAVRKGKCSALLKLKFWVKQIR